MKPIVRTAYRSAISEYAAAWQRGDLASAFAALERAHILSQRYLMAHVMTHLRMFRVGFARQDWREMFGQIIRLVSTVPGFLTGWVPRGNTGGADVSALKSMPLPADLEPVMGDFNVWRDVAWRVGIATLAVAAVFSALAIIEQRRAAAQDVLDVAWAQRTPTRVGPLSSTRSLEILPIVNWHAAPGLQSEPGVAYLIRTDQHTVLFDLGFNRAGTSPSPLEHNLAALGIDVEDIDAIFISHAHRDHVGGTEFERSKSFSFGLAQRPLPPDMRVLTPVAMHYPALPVETASGPASWLPGLATTGPIPRQLVLGRIDEQALLINVEGRGLVAIVGCGHQTIPKLMAHIKASFAEPLIGIVGDLHYPVPQGRLYVAGIDAQRRLASGKGLWEPMQFDQAVEELDLMKRQLDFLGLGSHDTSDDVHAMASEQWQGRYQRVVAGEPLCIGSDERSPLARRRCSAVESLTMR